MRRVAVGFAAAVAVLAVFFLAVDISGVGRQLAAADPLLFLVGFPLVLLALVCWSEAHRRLFLAAGADLGFLPAFAAYGAGMFTKQVVPMGHVGGPALVAYAYDRVVSLGYEQSIAVVTIGEAITIVCSASLALLGTVSVIAGESIVGNRRLLVVVTFFVVVSLLAAIFVIQYRRGAVRLVVYGFARVLRVTVGRLSGRVRQASDPDRVARGLARYYRTFDTVAGDRRALFVAFGLTALGWVCFAAPLYTVALAVGIELPLVAAFLLVPASGFTTVVPVPGGLGGYEIVLAGAIVALLGVDTTAAAAAVLLYRLCSYWFLLLVGGLSAAHASTIARAPTGAPLFEDRE